MSPYQYLVAKRRLGPQEELAKSLRSDPPAFQKALRRYLTLLITVKGHAWCMDVAAERNKMSKVIVHAIDEIFELGRRMP